MSDEISIPFIGTTCLHSSTSFQTIGLAAALHEMLPSSANDEAGLQETCVDELPAYMKDRG